MGVMVLRSVKPTRGGRGYKVRRNAVLKSAEHSEKLRVCLKSVLANDRVVQGASPSAPLDAIARVETKLNMFVQAVMCKLELLHAR